MAEAVNYTLGQWEELTVFTRDGAVPIDNNVSERESFEKQKGMRHPGSI